MDFNFFCGLTYIYTCPLACQGAGPFRLRAFYRNGLRDAFRAFLEVIWLFLTFYFTREEYQSFRISKAQHYNSRSAHFKSFWNCLDLLGLFLTYVQLLVHIHVMSSNTCATNKWPENPTDYWEETFPSVQQSQTLMYGWTLNFLFTW